VSEANKARVRQFYDAINEGNLDIVDELVADDFIDHEEFPGIPDTKEGVRIFFQTMRASFPDLRMEIEHLVAEDDKVFSYGKFVGTHNGEFMGIAPTGKSIAVPLADLIQIRDGKAIAHWGVTDGGALLQQLGITEAPA